MKRLILFLLLISGTSAFAQGNANAILRQQTFGVYSSLSDLAGASFDTNQLVLFSNGFAITREEFLDAFYASLPDDSSSSRKAKFLEKYETNYQKAFEAMDQNMDTSMAFQINFLKFKQELITPYLNEGKTRPEAEALPKVKFALRRYYVELLTQRIMHKEVWSLAGDENELRAFFFAHPELYQGQPFEISKTKVVYDYQKQLESALQTRLNQKFAYKVNSNLLKQI